MIIIHHNQFPLPHTNSLLHWLKVHNKSALIEFHAFNKEKAKSWFHKVSKISHILVHSQFCMCWQNIAFNFFSSYRKKTQNQLIFYVHNYHLTVALSKSWTYSPFEEKKYVYNQGTNSITTYREALVEHGQRMYEV